MTTPDDPMPPTRLALRGDLLDFTGAPAWETSTPPRCASGPITGC